VEDLTLPEALFVTGSHGQLEQAFLTLFVHAEQSLAQAPEKTITISRQHPGQAAAGGNHLQRAAGRSHSGGDRFRPGRDARA